jgi:hypothetical protein
MWLELAIGATVRVERMLSGAAAEAAAVGRSANSKKSSRGD